MRPKIIIMYKISRKLESIFQKLSGISLYDSTAVSAAFNMAQSYVWNNTNHIASHRPAV